MSSFLERYTLNTLLGQGGMGEVWYAFDHVLNQHVAVKMMHVKTSADSNMRRCFHREAEACSLLRHPNIVEIYDYGMTEEKRHYLSMEVIEGCTLHDLASCRLPLSAVLDLVCQILQALSHAHARGVVHRDLKAENVLVCMQDDRLNAKLVDFGLAALPQSLAKDDTRASRLGTPGYMAPEQVLHRSALIGPATDIYAVGILLYELLCGKLPFAGTSALETMRAQISAPVPALDWHPHFEGLKPEIKSVLCHAIETALAKKTWQRFVSVEEFESELKRIPCSWEDYGQSPLIERLRQSQRIIIVPSSHEIADISQKIRAMKGADRSDVHSVLNIDDIEFSAVQSLPKKHRTSPQLLTLASKLDEIENQMGADAIFYRDILTFVSVFGIEASMPEIECFWRLDDDASLADCWREALAAWCRYGLLHLCPTTPYNGQATMKIQFPDPDLIAYLQSHLTMPRLRRLKAQAAVALLECYADPTHDQMWRMASLWYEADDFASYAQMGSQSAQLAFSLGEHEIAAKRFQPLGGLFDSKLSKSFSDHSLRQAINWPEMFILAAQNAILMDRDTMFEAYCQRLKTWVEHTHEFVWVAHVKRLHAIRYLRQENYHRAVELLNASYEGFIKSGETQLAYRTHLLKADAEISLSDPMMAMQTLRTAQQAFTQMSCDIELASVNMRLTRLEWYACNRHASAQLSENALSVFEKHQAWDEKAQLQAWMDFTSFLSCPQNATLYRLIDSVSDVERHCNDVCLAHAQSYLLIAYALNENWEEIDDILLRYGNRSHHAHHTSVLTGTISCVNALKYAQQGDYLQAEDELSLAIASFGPQNRRARAWCHALLGIIAIFTQDLDKGMQSFGRACKDFGLLGDKFGELTVVISKSGLQAACGRFHEAFVSAVRGTELAIESDLPLHASLGFAIAAVSAIHVPLESTDILKEFEFEIAVPAIVRSQWQIAIQAALTHYTELSGCEALTTQLQLLLQDITRMTEEEPMIGFPSLELEL